MPVTSKTVTITERHEVRLDGQRIYDMLQGAGYLLSTASDFKVYFSVPGGGDWSNQDIEIDKDCPVIVTWKVTSTESGDG